MTQVEPGTSGEGCEEVAASDLALALVRHMGFVDHVRHLRWTAGHSARDMPWLQVVEASVGGRVHYLSAGASRVLDRPGYGTEFCFIASAPAADHVELIAMVAYLHSLPEHRLGVGHTLSIGRPVVAGSMLDRLLVSLPYPYGRQVEYVCDAPHGHARMLWLMPITEGEERYRHTHGLEALEQRFDEASVEFANASRASVV